MRKLSQFYVCATVAAYAPGLWRYVFHRRSVCEDQRQQYLESAVGQDGDVVDVLAQARRDGNAAERFFKRLLKRHGDEPPKIETDKLRSYGVTHRKLVPEAIPDTSQYANNRAEIPHQSTRVQERGLRRFKSHVQAQHLIAALCYRELRQRDFASWKQAVAS